MNTQTIKNALNDQIKQASNLDLHRDYLGISQISKCPRAVVRQYRQGINPDETAYRMSFAGYHQENNIHALLVMAGIAQMIDVREVTAPFDSRLKGHIDGLTVDGEIIEIKSVNSAKYERIKRDSHTPHDHYCQVQLYMRYSGAPGAFIIYRNRETYEHEVFFIRYNQQRAVEFEERAKMLLEFIDHPEILPPCHCKKCSESMG